MSRSTPLRGGVVVSLSQATVSFSGQCRIGLTGETHAPWHFSFDSRQGFSSRLRRRRAGLGSAPRRNSSGDPSGMDTLSKTTSHRAHTRSGGWSTRYNWRLRQRYARCVSATSGLLF